MNPLADLTLPNLPRLSTRDVPSALRTLAGIGVADARIDTLLGYTPEQAGFVRELCGKLAR